MKHKTYFRTLLPLLIILSMMLAAVHTTPVYAQGEEPPAATEPASDSPAAEEPAGDEPAATEPAGGEQPPTEPAAGEAPATEPPLTEPAASEPPAPETTEGELPAADNGEAVAQAVEALAESELVLVDAQGEALPLASQEAAQTLAAADPYFYHASCAGGKCSYLTFADALTNFSTKNATGFIYVEGSKSYTENVAIDGAVAGYGGLTGLKWQQADSKAVIDPGEAAPIINGNITIANFSHAFDLYGLSVNGDVTLNNITGNVGLTNVQVDGGSGIEIANGSGGVSLTNVSSTNSSDDGITIINRGGNVNLNEVAANSNDGYGARIYASGTVKIVNSTFDYNGTNGIANDGGLFVTNSAAISLLGVSASKNLGDGAYFDEVNAGLTMRNSIFNDNIDPTSGQVFGLWAANATNKGNLTFENVQANQNGSGNWTLQTNGNIALKTVEGIGAVSGYGAVLQTLGTGTVTITGADFNDNNGSSTGFGLYVLSNGNVTLDGVAAIDNDQYGAWIDNDALTGKTVTVLGGAFGNNAGGNGLWIDASGMITLNGVSTWNNSGYGMYLSNTTGTAGVSLLNTLGSNSASDNNTGGLYIRSKGALVLNGVDASGNQNYGANLNNCLASGPEGSGTCAGTGAVTITQSSFNNTWLDSGGTAPVNASGLLVYSKGLITLNGVSASDSQNSSGRVGVLGALLSNDFDGATAGVSILNTLGNNRFSQNQNGSGLFIRSNGAVSMTNVDASNNSASGINIENNSGTAGVTLLATGNFWNNLSNNKYGLSIDSRGAVNLNRLNVNQNTDFGAAITNSGGTAGVTITNGQFNETSLLEGLTVTSKGAIKLTNVQANGNHSTGAFLNNTGGTAGVTIAIGPNGSNSFNQNGGTGLEIHSKGAVLLNNLSAGENTGGGVNVDTCNDSGLGCTGKGAVTFANTAGWWGWFDGNGAMGIDVDAGGNISMARINANGNSAGANIALTTHGTGTISLLQGNFNNGGAASTITAATGAITLNNIQANNNAGGGMAITGGSLTLLSTLGDNHFDQNSGLGLVVEALTNITLNNIFVNGNQTGAIVQAANGNLVINTGQFNNNTGDTEAEAALTAGASNGSITVNNIEASNNGTLIGDPGSPGAGSLWMNGAMFANDSGKGITITNSRFSNNYGSGMVLSGDNNAVLDGIDASSNYSQHDEDDGAGSTITVYHSGVYAGVEGTFTLTNKTGSNYFNGNAGNGLQLEFGGKVALSNANASENGGNGFDMQGGADAQLTNLQSNNNAGVGFTLQTTANAVLTNLSGNNNNGGLHVETLGSVGLAKSAFYGNTTYGVKIEGDGEGPASNVTVANTTISNTRSGDGLVVTNEGLITLNTVSSYGNTGSGAILNNSASATAGVIITAPKGYNFFGSNLGSGLSVSSNGAIALTNLRTDRNGLNGLDVTGRSTVTITNLVAIQNSENGAQITTLGAVTIDKMFSVGNGLGLVTGHGLKVITNDSLTGGANVTVRNSTFSGNGEYGVWADVGVTHFLDFYASTWLGNHRDGGSGNVFMFTGTGRVNTLAVP